MLLALTSLIACSLAARGFRLQSRAIQSSAVCSSDFSWADNTQGQTPCYVAASVDAVCNDGSWTLPALNSSVVYDAPDGAIATVCTCSWASYNLISACTDCQGFANETTSWSAYSFNCAGLISDTYFPTNLSLGSILIPFWATTNPANWTNEQFNSAEAQAISNKNLPDVGSPSATSTPTATSTTSTSTSTKSASTPIGAIVGGVVGGVVVLLAAIIVGICLIRRASRVNRNTDPSPLLLNHTRLPSHSDVTGISHNMTTQNMSTPIGYSSLSSSPMRPTSPTIRTHASSSIRSFPFFSSGGSTIISPSMRQQSPPPVLAQRDETVVEPFTLPPSNNHDPDRKQANGAYPVYDPPTAPPPIRMEVRSTTPTQGGRARFNPPAYSEQTRASPDAGVGSSSRQRSPPTLGQLHAKKGSAETLQSFTSGGSAPRVGGSNPAISNRLAPPTGTVMNPQLNLNTSTNAVNGHGRQLSGNTSSDMDRNRRPVTDDSFSVGDIA